MIKNLRQTKVDIKNSILEVLQTKGSADMEVLISQYKLDTAFGRDVILGIMEDMTKVGLIEIKDGRLRKPPQDEVAEART